MEVIRRKLFYMGGVQRDYVLLDLTVPVIREISICQMSNVKCQTHRRSKHSTLHYFMTSRNQ